MIAPFLTLLAPYVRSITPVGSRVTCNPAPSNTDADYLVLLMPFDLLPPEEASVAIAKLERDVHYALKAGGWELGGSRPDNEIRDNCTDTGRFNSYTHPDSPANLIITAEREFHERFISASVVCQSLNLLDKAERIALFQAVLYGNRTHNLPHLLIADTPAEKAAEALLEELV